MKKVFFLLFGLGLLLLSSPTRARGQGAYGERQFYNQLNSLRNQVRPHFNQARGYLGQLRQQGVNTSSWERQLNWVESQLNSVRWPGSTGGRMGPGFQTINPFGDYLFHGVSIRPKDGKLETRHLDPDGLVARAEAWARELRDIGKDLTSRQGVERQKYLSDINDKLTQLAAITNEQLQLASLGGGQELRPQTLGEELSIAGLPRLEGDAPALLRDPFGRDDPTTAPAPNRPSIDEVYVPLPPPSISAFDACAGAAGCIVGAKLGEGMGWLQERYWDARVWANDPTHREWLGDAATIATLPLAFGDALALLGARTAGGRLGARAVGQLTAEQDAALLAIFKKHGIPFRIMGSKAEVELGLERRADPLLREFLPLFRSKKWQSTGSDLDLHLDPGIVEKVGWKKTLEMSRDIRELLTGKRSGKTGLEMDLVGYSRRYSRDIDELPSIGYGPDGRSQTLGWGSSIWEPKPSSEVGVYPKWN